MPCHKWSQRCCGQRQPACICSACKGLRRHSAAARSIEALYKRHTGIDDAHSGPLQTDSCSGFLLFTAGSALCARICLAMIATGAATGCLREAVRKQGHLTTHQLHVGCMWRGVIARLVRRGSIGNLQMMKKRTCRLVSWLSRYSTMRRHLSVQSGARFKYLTTKERLYLGAAIRALSMSAS